MSKVVDLQAAKKAKPKSGSILRMAKKGASGEIYLYGVIGDSFFSDGITDKAFADQMKALGNVTNIDLRINSDGGDVFQGRSIFNLLMQHSAKITVYVDGWAASIASLIAMAGDEIVMGDGTFIMIHNPWGVSVGGSTEMRRVADLLDSVEGTMIDTYAKRSGAKRDDINAWMEAETTMSADEAIERGFADRMAEGVKVAAFMSKPEIFKNLPQQLRPNRARAQAALDRIAAAKKS